MVTGVSSSGLRRQRHETDHALPFGTNIKNQWSYASIPYAYAGITLLSASVIEGGRNNAVGTATPQPTQALVQ